ncbi:hypothetical protein HN587_03220 [Candidatus Woesearchaeota archaeon]|jgi:hypothetical protein|nr:hypothetical protein [Candidatus Woesearchaeota archaeon]
MDFSQATIQKTEELCSRLVALEEIIQAEELTLAKKTTSLADDSNDDSDEDCENQTDQALNAQVIGTNLRSAISSHKSEIVREGILDLLEYQIETCEIQSETRLMTWAHTNALSKQFIQTAQEVNNSGCFDDYRLLIATAKRSSSFDRERKDSHDWWAVLNYTEVGIIDSSERYTPFAALKFLREKGEDTYAEQLGAAILNNVDGEPGHLWGGIHAAVDSCYPLASEFREGVDLVFETASKITTYGSPVYALLTSFSYAYEKLKPKGREHLQLKFLKVLSKIAPISAHMVWAPARDQTDLDDIYEKYCASGLEPKFLENLERIPEVHEHDLPPEHKYARKTSFAYEYFKEYPEIVGKIGEADAEKLFTILREIHDVDSQVCAKDIGGAVESAMKILLSKEGAKWRELQKTPTKLKAIVESVKGIAQEKGKDEYRIMHKVSTAVKSLETLQNLETLLPFIGTIANYGLFNYSTDVKEFIDSGERPEVIKEMLSHYAVARGLGATFKNKKQWYAALSRKIGIGGIRATKDFLSSVATSSQREDYISLLPQIIAHDLDLKKSLELVKELTETSHTVKSRSLTGSLGDLEFIINSDNPIEEKRAFLEKIRPEQKYLFFLSPDTFDFENWKSRAEQAEKDYYAEEVSVVLPDQQLFSYLLDSATSTDARNVARQLLTLQKNGTLQLHGFTQGQEFGIRNVSGLTKNVDPVYATELMVYGLISRRSDKILQASELYDGYILRSSRDHVHKCDTPVTALYHEIKKDLRTILRTADTETPEITEQKIEAAKRIVNEIKEFYIEGEDETSGKCLKAMVQRIEAMFDQTQAYDELLCRTQPYTLLDLFGGHRTSCCGFIDEKTTGSKPHSLYYHAEPAIAIQHLIPRTLGSEWDAPIGATILARCKTPEQHSVLLVDSAEGGQLLQSLPEDIYLDLFLQ